MYNETYSTHRKTGNAKLKNIQNKCSKLTDNILKCQRSRTLIQDSLQQLRQMNSALKTSFQQEDNTKKMLLSNQKKSQEDLLRLKQKLEDLHHAKFDGSLIWTIDFPSRMLKEENRMKKTSF